LNKLKSIKRRDKHKKKFELNLSQKIRLKPSASMPNLFINLKSEEEEEEVDDDNSNSFDASISCLLTESIINNINFSFNQDEEEIESDESFDYLINDLSIVIY
jgi:hypothetical protein